MSTDAGDSPQPLADLLADVEACVTRYVVVPTAARVAIVLWVAHAHAIEACEATPYLAVTSAEKRSGKTRLVEVLAGLVPRPWQVVRPSEAVVFRKIKRDTPTLLLDEVDAIFHAKADASAEGLRAILNAGNRRDAVVSRCQGPALKLVDFPVFCAKILAGIGGLPDTIADRSIPVRLLRKKKSEQVARFRQRTFRVEVTPLREGLATWAREATPELSLAEPEVPEPLNDRAGEAWEPLFAIADMAEGDWPKRARLAALELHGGERDDESHGVVLLRAIRSVFADRGTEHVLTLHLLRALVEHESEPWGVWWGKDVENGNTRGPAAKLATLLRPYGVAPTTVRAEEERGKGYKHADFADAFDRYLGSEDGTTGQPIPDVGFPVPAGRDSASSVTSSNGARGLAPQGMSPCHDSDAQEVDQGSSESAAEASATNGARTGADLFALAAARGFPPVRLAQGVSLLGGAEAWQRFAANPIAEYLPAALAALQQGPPP